jgi:hypothetical protein
MSWGPEPWKCPGCGKEITGSWDEHKNNCTLLHLQRKLEAKNRRAKPRKPDK